MVQRQSLKLLQCSQGLEVLIVDMSTFLKIELFQCSEGRQGLEILQPSYAELELGQVLQSTECLVRFRWPLILVMATDQAQMCQAL